MSQKINTPAPFGWAEVRYADGMRRIPIVLVIGKLLRQHPDGCDSVEILCPYCGERHFHSWGEGPRGPHCREKQAGWTDYYINEPADVPEIWPRGLARRLRN